MVSKKVEHAIMIQEKQVEGAKNAALNNTTVPSFGYDSVHEEHKKCDVKTSHLFVMVSDNNFKATDYGQLEDNEIVLPRTEHEKAIWPLLALLGSHNHAYRPKMPIKRKHPHDCSTN